VRLAPSRLLVSQLTFFQAFGSESDARTNGGDAQSITMESPQAGGAYATDETAGINLHGLVIDDDDKSRSSYARDQPVSLSAGTTHAVSRAPPHMLAQEQRRTLAGRAPHWKLPDMEGPSQASYQTSSAPSATGSASIGGTSQRGQQPPIRYNAIGPQGQVSTRYKTPTMPSDTASSISTVRQEAKGRTGWAKPASLSCFN